MINYFLEEVFAVIYIRLCQIIWLFILEEMTVINAIITVLKGTLNLKPPVKKGKNPRRVSFAARFAGMRGPMKDSKGRPTRKALALRKWRCR